ncbi:disulfide bond formation protein B [Pseudomonas japonica]|uniref:Disulfide bond formation protein B n=1 Tax=Pseudomonas japonica TaxID=256466 RepID=A0A239C9K6_9PSED|nr:disulfide bond formation protein B [Pseudomonas japonica]SNS16572.1 disulfide bond formation protein DsbB [Pseudomonas japonica]
MPLACLRSIFFPAFLASVLILAGSFYLEHGLGLLACPLCQGQRLVLGAFSLTCLAALVQLSFRAGVRCHLWLCLVLALCGALLASRHVWLQDLSLSPEVSGLHSMTHLLAHGTPAEWLQSMLLGSAECVPITWSFLSLSVPEWSLLAFLGLALMMLFRLIPRRQMSLGDSLGS